MTFKQKSDLLESENNLVNINEAILKDEYLLSFVCHTFYTSYQNIKQIINSHILDTNNEFISKIREAQCKPFRAYIKDENEPIKICDCVKAKSVALNEENRNAMLYFSGFNNKQHENKH